MRVSVNLPYRPWLLFVALCLSFFVFISAIGVLNLRSARRTEVAVQATAVSTDSVALELRLMNAFWRNLLARQESINAARAAQDTVRMP